MTSRPILSTLEIAALGALVLMALIGILGGPWQGVGDAPSVVQLYLGAAVWSLVAMVAGLILAAAFWAVVSIRRAQQHRRYLHSLDAARAKRKERV